MGPIMNEFYGKSCMQLKSKGLVSQIFINY